jgi:hypothetical protein
LERVEEFYYSLKKDFSTNLFGGTDYPQLQGTFKPFEYQTQYYSFLQRFHQTYGQPVINMTKINKAIKEVDKVKDQMRINIAD